MRKLSTLLLFVLLVQSCTSIKTIPIKGDYKNANTFYFDKSQDEVWNSVMKYIVQNGLSIKSFERASGVLFGDGFISNSNTYEDDKYQLINKNAYFVTEKKYDGTTTYVPYSIEGKYNIYVYQEKGKTALYINLFNLYPRIPTYTTTVSVSTYDLKVLSLGNFEKMIADSLKF